MRPTFESKDKVHFEVNPEGNGPRWCLNEDKGYTGKWTVGIVTEVSDVAITLDALFLNRYIKQVVFPNWKSSDYDEEQWWYPGYLVGLDDPGPNCDCGCGDNSGTHWNFCAKGKWLDAHI